MIELEQFTGDEINIIEIYLKKDGIDNKIDINIDENTVKKIYNKFSNWKSNDYVTYHKNSLSYCYDLSNDNQVLNTRALHNTDIKNNYVVFSYKNYRLSTYSFPCTNTIDYKIKYNLSESKITNRISVFIRKDDYANSVYIEYKHSPQAENKKNEETINNILNKIIND